MESLIFHHGQKFKRNIHFLDQTSVWRKTDSLMNFPKKIILQVLRIPIIQIQIYPLHILHPIDEII